MNEKANEKRLKVLILLALISVFSACVSPAKDPVPELAPSMHKEESPSPVEHRLPPGNGLDTAAFRKLPTEARDYLGVLAGAFLKKDKDFLVSQGETQYEKELRFRLDEKVYLALLYRTGPYSEDMLWKEITPPLLDVKTVRGIEYTSWEEKGPMIEIKGRIYPEKGEPVPCNIVLIWRLEEPKILGEYP